MPPRLINIIEIPLLNLKNEKIAIIAIFKMTRNYKKFLRKTDLKSILSAQKYIQLFRHDENLSMLFVIS